MSRYIDADKLIDDMAEYAIECIKTVNAQPTADVVEVDKVQKEIDYWHDKAQSYEQTIMKLALNKADVVEVVRCKDCKRHIENDVGDIFCNYHGISMLENDYCNFGERGTT